MMSPTDQFRSAWHSHFRRDLEFKSLEVLGGGSIIEVYRIGSDQGDFVLKLNQSNRFPGRFSAEARGLSLLREKIEAGVPEVVLVQDNGNTHNASYWNICRWRNRFPTAGRGLLVAWLIFINIHQPYSD